MKVEQELETLIEQCFEQIDDEDLSKLKRLLLKWVDKVDDEIVYVRSLEVPHDFTE